MGLFHVFQNFENLILRKRLSENFGAGCKSLIWQGAGIPNLYYLLLTYNIIEVF
jgi:hypothetical protein